MPENERTDGNAVSIDQRWALRETYSRSACVKMTETLQKTVKMQCT